MAHLILRAQLIQSLICFILFARLTSQASAPTITPPPNLVHQRQEDEGANFFGYLPLSDGRYITETCEEGGIYYASSRWAACLTNTADLWTGCTGASVFLAPIGTGTCPPSMTCNSVLVYNNPTDATALSYVGCWSSSLTKTYYRQISTTASASSEARAGSTSTSTSTSSTVSSSPTETPAPRNLAWVAGPVVGGIAGIAIIALLVWIIVLLLRKRQSHAPTAPENQFVQPDYAAKPPYQAQVYPSPVPEQPPSVMSMGPPQYPPSTPTYELDPVTYHGARPGA
ncbi:unnamed protein product [Clonostachys byssicola]|uniref:Uncharacterized protein n=1 Tax=Clonostachys byssicola TaxID=160290 RepID=A0A9N9UGI4_9HYPO|nr:unnamed protein product [Clonostachys byssicola]